MSLCCLIWLSLTPSLLGVAAVTQFSGRPLPFSQHERQEQRRHPYGVLHRFRGGAAQEKGKVVFTYSEEDQDPYIPKEAVAPSPFVQAAPLILAVACDDGSVALVAAHTQTKSGQEEPEPLLYQENPFIKSDTEGYSQNANNDDTSDSQDSSSLRNKPILYNLPENFGGPFRIYSLFSGNGHSDSSLVLLLAGWRADCETLLEVARNIVASERNQLGSSSAVSGHVVASQLSMFLAQRAASEYERSLSCTAMLASSFPQKKSDKEKNLPQIWLTDPTGAYPVRALCVGRDSVAINSHFLMRNFETARQAHTSFLAFLRGHEEMSDLSCIRLEMAMLTTRLSQEAEIRIPRGDMLRVRLEDFIENQGETDQPTL